MAASDDLVPIEEAAPLLSLDQIAALLAGPEAGPRWKRVVAARREALDTQIRQMTAARDSLDHMLTCPREHSPDGCPYFEQAIWQPPAERTVSPSRPGGQ
jgi:MerR family transcriptional regulator, copper efflux regulator